MKDVNAINQLETDYKILYEALVYISKMLALNYVPIRMQACANRALGRVTIKP